MKSPKNWIIVALASALALSIVMGGVAQTRGGVTVELLVWQDTTDPERHYVTTRLAGESWQAQEAVSVALDRESGRWRYGKYTFELAVVATCNTGIAVPHPTENKELVEDCNLLLGLRDWFDPVEYDFYTGEMSTVALNWSADIPMKLWTGVTVGGTPRRVTKLELSGMALDGEVGARLGNLTGLRELRLDHTGLQERLPSKLAQLTNLTHVYLGANPLEGCVPSSLWTVAHNDVATLALPDCGPPTVVVSHGTRLTEGTYTYGGTVFDIPEGVVLWLSERVPEDSFTEFYLQRGPDAGSNKTPGTLGIGGGEEEERSTSDGLFDFISDSLWVDDR